MALLTPGTMMEEDDENNNQDNSNVLQLSFPLQFIQIEDLIREKEAEANNDVGGNDDLSGSIDSTVTDCLFDCCAMPSRWKDTGVISNRAKFKLKTIRFPTGESVVIPVMDFDDADDIVQEEEDVGVKEYSLEGKEQMKEQYENNKKRFEELLKVYRGPGQGTNAEGINRKYVDDYDNGGDRIKLTFHNDDDNGDEVMKEFCEGKDGILSECPQVEGGTPVDDEVVVVKELDIVENSKKSTSLAPKPAELKQTITAEMTRKDVEKFIENRVQSHLKALTFADTKAVQETKYVTAAPANQKFPPPPPPKGVFGVGRGIRGLMTQANREKPKKVIKIVPNNSENHKLSAFSPVGNWAPGRYPRVLGSSSLVEQVAGSGTTQNLQGIGAIQDGTVKRFRVDQQVQQQQQPSQPITQVSESEYIPTLEPQAHGSGIGSGFRYPGTPVNGKIPPIRPIPVPLAQIHQQQQQNRMIRCSGPSTTISTTTVSTVATTIASTQPSNSRVVQQEPNNSLLRPSVVQPPEQSISVTSSGQINRGQSIMGPRMTATVEIQRVPNPLIAATTSVGTVVEVNSRKEGRTPLQVAAATPATIPTLMQPLAIVTRPEISPVTPVGSPENDMMSTDSSTIEPNQIPMETVGTCPIEATIAPNQLTIPMETDTAVPISPNRVTSIPTPSQATPIIRQEIISVTPTSSSSNNRFQAPETITIEDNQGAMETNQVHLVTTDLNRAPPIPAPSQTAPIIRQQVSQMTQLLSNNRISHDSNNDRFQAPETINRVPIEQHQVAMETNQMHLIDVDKKSTIEPSEVAAGSRSRIHMETNAIHSVPIITDANKVTPVPTPLQATSIIRQEVSPRIPVSSSNNRISVESYIGRYPPPNAIRRIPSIPTESIQVPAQIESRIPMETNRITSQPIIADPNRVTVVAPQHRSPTTTTTYRISVESNETHLEVSRIPVPFKSPQRVVPLESNATNLKCNKVSAQNQIFVEPNRMALSKSNMEVSRVPVAVESNRNHEPSLEPQRYTIVGPKSNSPVELRSCLRAPQVNRIIVEPSRNPNECERIHVLEAEALIPSNSQQQICRIPTTFTSSSTISETHNERLRHYWAMYQNQGLNWDKVTEYYEKYHFYPWDILTARDEALFRHQLAVKAKSYSEKIDSGRMPPPPPAYPNNKQQQHGGVGVGGCEQRFTGESYGQPQPYVQRQPQNHQQYNNNQYQQQHHHQYHHQQQQPPPQQQQMPHSTSTPTYNYASQHVQQQRMQYQNQSHHQWTGAANPQPQQYQVRHNYHHHQGPQQPQQLQYGHYQSGNQHTMMTPINTQCQVQQQEQLQQQQYRAPPTQAYHQHHPQSQSNYYYGPPQQQPGVATRYSRLTSSVAPVGGGADVFNAQEQQGGRRITTFVPTSVIRRVTQQVVDVDLS